MISASSNLLKNSLKTKNKYSFYFPNGIFKFFDLHEYQSKIFLRNYGLRVQNGDLARNPQEANQVASTLKGELILKAQVHAGGRGKGVLTSGLKGGVKICRTIEELDNYAKQMIGYNLITAQTPKEGLPVKSVLVLECVDIKKQFYLAIVLDRTHQSPVIMVSKEGGVEIEEVAKHNPDAIKVFPVDVIKGLTEDTVKNIVDALDLEKEEQKKEAANQVKNLYTMFNKLDATQVEINPWATNEKDELFLIDAKINIDESASFRQPEVMKMKENSEASEDVDANEVLANKVGLNYIGLRGNIGCLVNGAGLAMATMDIIKLKKGEPANFLDVGGGANTEQVTQALEILKNHPKVKTILVNIFGGIMRCDIIAQGIIEAVNKVGINVPIIVRLTGTNAEKGRKILEEFAENNKGKVNFITANDLDQAAEFAVKHVEEVESHKLKI
jgi:succinyl-CoA synthetase beta subunit